MVNDHLSDFITRIRNAYHASLVKIEVPATNMVESVAKVLVSEKYLEGCERVGKTLAIKLRYQKSKQPVLLGIRRVSKPGARRYESIKDVSTVWEGVGINILSTPKGVMSDKTARKLKVGGEVLAQVW